jgi:hypothetical protein
VEHNCHKFTICNISMLPKYYFVIRLKWESSNPLFCSSADSGCTFEVCQRVNIWYLLLVNVNLSLRLPLTTALFFMIITDTFFKTYYMYLMPIIAFLWTMPCFNREIFWNTHTYNFKFSVAYAHAPKEAA